MAATIGGVVAGSLASELVRRFFGKRGFYESKVSPLEERVLARVIPVLERAAKDHAAMVEDLRQFEARTTAFQDGITAQVRGAATKEELAVAMVNTVGRDEISEALAGVVTRQELELSLQAAAQQILRVAQNGQAPSNGANLRDLQERVAGISQQLGLG